jgi:cytochrome P450
LSRQTSSDGPAAASLRPLPRTAARSGLLEGLAFLRDPDFAARRFEALGDVYETTLFGQRTVFVRGERAVADLFAQPAAVRGWWPASVRELLGPLSLANRSGPGHLARRRVVGQLFSAAALRRYAPDIVVVVDDLARDLAGSPGPVALVPRLRRFAFQVIAGTVLGLDSGDREALFVDFETWTRGLFALPVAWPGSRLARARKARRRLLSRLGSVLREAQEAAAAGRPQAAGGLDLLLGGVDEIGVPLGDADVVEQLLLLLFAGYETTASSLSCLMLTLLQHPEALAWLEEELEPLRWPPEAATAATALDPSRAPRLDAVVKEVMRLTPPVGGFFRRTAEPIALAGVRIPADRVVQVSIAASHRHAPGIPEEELVRFRPQRHLEPGGCPMALLPFGGGQRVCLGRALAELEIRLLAVGLLSRLRFELVAGQDLGLAVMPSPTPREGLQVLVRPRPGAQAGIRTPA